MNDVLGITGGSTPKSAGQAVHASTSGILTKSCDEALHAATQVVPVVSGPPVSSDTTCCQDSGLGSSHPLSTHIFSSASLLCLLPLELRWVGHLFRMPSNRLPRRVLYGELVNGQRLLWYMDHIRRLLNKCNISTAELEQLSTDRDTWKSACACQRLGNIQCVCRSSS